MGDIHQNSTMHDIMLMVCSADGGCNKVFHFLACFGVSMVCNEKGGKYVTKTNLSSGKKEVFGVCRKLCN